MQPLKSVKPIVFAILCLLCVQAVQAQVLNGQKVHTRADTLRGALRPERTCYDVTSYNLTVEVNIKGKSIIGSNIIAFTAITDFTRLQIDLFPELRIESITWQNKTLPFQREAGAVFITFPETIQAGTSGNFKVNYSGTPRMAKNPPWDGGMSWATDDRGNPWVGVSCQGLGASVWWPNKDHLSDEPDHMTITIIAPDSLQAVSNGNLMSETPMSNHRKSTVWEVSYPINNYNVTLNIGKYAHFSDTYININGQPLALDYYVLDYNLAQAKQQFEQVKPMLACYEQYLTAYPFIQDGFAVVETPYVGMEHQGAIAYGNKFANGYLGFDYSGINLDFDYILIHETGHEWWGNHVSMQDLADMWIHEGFCTYSEAIYVECRYGKETAIKYIDHMKNLVSLDRPIIGDYQVNMEGSGDMYHKGALFLHTLRTLTDNDSLWWSMIAGIQQDFAMQTVTTAQIEAYMAQKAGKDFSKEFDLYLRHTKLPQFEYKLTDSPKGLQVDCRWVSEVPDFHMPLRYLDAQNNWVWMYPTSDWQTMILPGIKAKNFRLDDKNLYFLQRMALK